MLELLLDNYPFDINAVDTNGNTALHLAAYRNHDAVVSVLLSKGADINAQDNNGMTPLHWVCVTTPPVLHQTGSQREKH